MTKKYSAFFRKHGNPASVVPQMLAEMQENSSEESRKLFYLQKLNEDKQQSPMTNQEAIRQAIEATPEGKVAVFFNLQHLYLLNEKEFQALDAYLKMAKERGVKRDFHRGFHHGPSILWAPVKKQIPDRPNAGKSFYDYPTVVMYL